MEGKQDAHLLLQCQPFAVLASLRVLAALALAPLELWHGLACRRMYEEMVYKEACTTEFRSKFMKFCTLKYMKFFTY